MFDMHIPILWDQSEHRYLNYNVEYWRDHEVNQHKIWIDSGHKSDVLTFNVFRFKDGLPSWCNYLDSFFTDLEHVSFSMHECLPGRYIPNHYDHYNYFTKAYNCHINDIKRYIVFLEPWQQGHFFTLKDKVYSNWSAGDVVSWSGQELHGLANLGTVNRYTLQVTGIKIN